MSETTKVIFRKWPEGDVLALFPEEAFDNQAILCNSYQHIGQHGGASLSIVQWTKLAKPEEYADLKKELERIGYKLEVRRRITPQMRAVLYSKRLRRAV